MQRPTLAPVLRAALLLAAACNAPAAPAPDVELRVAAARVTRDASRAATVPFAVVNGGTRAVLLTGVCGDRLLPAVERREGAGWVQYAGGFCTAVHDMSPKPLAPGSARADSVRVAAVGSYRLSIDVAGARVVSGAFAVE